jgi:predicted Zn-dependent peptidase
MTRSSPPALLLALGIALATAAGPPPAAGQDLAAFEKRTTVHTLKNGWTFLIVERPGLPIFSFATVADVGSAQEVPGITGLAHMFEHMAFKGTRVVGTNDWPSEQKALAAVEAAYQAYYAARTAPQPDTAKVEKLLADFQARQAEAARFIVSNEFSDLITREGGVGINAFTSTDETAYFYSLPANKVELFAYLESERFLHPVFREFYKERDVVQEERRMSIDSQPVRRLVEQALAAAFVAHPYKQPIVGYMSDLQAFSETDAERFYASQYVAANMVTAVVGAVDARTLVPLLDKYFGRIPAHPRPEPLRTVEPPGIAEREVVMQDASRPVYLECYLRPAVTHPDNAVYEAIDDILSGGPASRLHRSLVVDKKIAASVGSFSGLPGVKYPHLWSVFANTAPGATNAQVQGAVRAEIERLKSEDVSERELARFRRHARARLVQSMGSDLLLALRLAESQRLYGDWRELFHRLDAYNRVTAADVRRVANETFKPNNRTVARIENVPAAAPAAAGAGAGAEGKTSKGKEGTR